MDTRKNNKVLSVSYGHFSCSVEGFDDSFEVMTSVVEFFRNLAQEDRYFGAEPVKLTPDLIAELSKKTQTSDVEVTQDADNLTVRKSPHQQMVPAATSAAFALSERLKRLRAAETDMSENAQSDGETDLVEIVADPIRQTANPKPAKSETTVTETTVTETHVTEPALETVSEPAVATPSVSPAEKADDTAMAANLAQETEQQELAPSDTSVTADELGSDNSLAPQSDPVAENTMDAPSEPETLPPAPTHTSATPPADAPALTLEQRLRRIQAVTQKKREQQSASGKHTQDATQSTPAHDHPDAAQQPTSVESEPLSLQAQSDDAHNPNNIQGASVSSEQIAEKISEQPPQDKATTDDNYSRSQRVGTTHVIQVANAPQEDATSARGGDVDTDQQGTEIASTDAPDDAEQTIQEAPLGLRQMPDPDKKEVAPKRPERKSMRSIRNAENLERPSTDMVRLLKTAKEQMDEPETHRKRNALDHLRAAVAATLADNSILSRDKSKRDIDNTPDENIAPKRPAKPKSAATDVPVTPLVLQMDQRVDLDQPASTPDASSA